MGLIGSIFGGAIGLALGGPLGAVAGGILGHGISERIERKASGTEQNRAAFFIATFSMLAKLAKADGRVSPEEIRLVEDFMRGPLRLEEKNREVAIRIFREARDNPTAFEEYSAQFATIFAHDELTRASMLDLLVRMALADGTLHSRELELLAGAAERFGLGAGALDQLLLRHGARRGVATGPGGKNPRPYAVLGIDPDADDDALKRRYRKLVAELHPDKAIAKGLPEEFVDYAEERFREVQEAWEAIRAQRGIR